MTNGEMSIKTALIDSYTTEADARDHHQVPEWKHQERQLFIQYLRQHQLTTVLEIGAGTGRDSAFFQQNGLTVTCIDLTPSMVELCRAKGLQAFAMDVESMTLPSESFEAIYLMNSLVHLPKGKFSTVLANIEKVLTPNGVCFNCMWGGVDQEGIYEKDDHDPQRYFSFYTDEQIQRIMKDIFRIEMFRTVAVEGRDLHPQIMYLRKKHIG